MSARIRTIIRTDKPPKTNGLFPIYYCIYLSGCQVKTPAKLEVDRKYWDKKKGIVLKGWKNAKEINAVLQKKCLDFEKWVIQNELMEVEITRELVKEYFSKKKTAKPKQISFFQFYEEQMNLWQNKLTEGTLLVYQNTLNVLKQFKKQIQFSDLNLTFIEEFDLYLKNERGNKGVAYNRHKNFNYQAKNTTSLLSG